MLNNPIIYEDVANRLNKYLSGDEIILELGCGNGYVLKLLSEKGYKVTGMDFSTERVKLASKTAPKADIVVGEFLNHDFGGQLYDVIIALEFIHLFPPKQFERIKKPSLLWIPGTVEQPLAD